MASDSDSSLPSPIKRLKTLTPCSPFNPQSKREIKSYQNESQENEQSTENKPFQTCTICFSEDGKSASGKLDCCSHYFCFICIMEWAKIESRCPSCKRRFTTIRRPPIDGLFLRERIVNVPVRDQAGNSTNGPYDPYSQVCCCVCNGMEDESLLLLCDLCDSAAHTYCVDLGHTVPEGDWFCHDCTISRTVHSNNETDTDLNNKNILPTFAKQVPISDIVRESNDRVAGKYSNQAIGTGARTLNHCRNIHSHIRVLRENWTSLRRGSLRFPSSSSASVDSNAKQYFGAISNYHTGQTDPSTSGSFQQPGNPGDSRNSDDVEKAWKMLERSKAIHKRPPKEAYNISSSCNIVKSQTLKNKDIGRSGIDKYPYCSPEKKTDKSPKLDKQKYGMVAHKETLESDGGILTNSFCYKPSSTRKVWTGHDDVCRENGISVSKKIVNGASSSSGKVDVSVRSLRSEKSGVDSNARKDCGAKSEIQSLVKINLKLLSRDKKLEIKVFKEVARAATHTILGACGLEIPGSSIKGRTMFYSLPSSPCSHDDHIKELHKSTLMPNCCRECFFIFVKDVVSAILTEKVGCTKP